MVDEDVTDVKVSLPEVGTPHAPPLSGCIMLVELEEGDEEQAVKASEAKTMAIDFMRFPFRGARAANPTLAPAPPLDEDTGAWMELDSASERKKVGVGRPAASGVRV